MDEENLEDSFMVPCMELCQLTVKSLPSNHVPPASDWACYDTSTGIHCDIDVSNDAFEGITFETYTNSGGSKYGERPASLNTSQLDRNVYFRPDLVYVDPDAAATTTHVADEVGLDQMRISIANLFRIYPPFQVEFEDGTANDSVVADPLVPDFFERRTHTYAFAELDNSDEKAMSERNDTSCHQAIVGAVPRETSLWQRIKRNGKTCKCPAGSVVTGESWKCSDPAFVEDRRKFDPTEMTGHGCMCASENDVFDNLPAHCDGKFPTSFLDGQYQRLPCSRLKSYCYDPKVKTVCPRTCGVQCIVAKPRKTFEHPLPPPALDPPRHERRGRKSGKGGKKKAWEDEAVRIAVKAQAYTAKALRSMGSRQVPHLVTKWFGANDDFTRSEVSGILNGVHRLLSNVNYVFPGEDCTPSTYAYVYPSPPWNKNMRGRYVFHLCDLYMNTIEGDKIETLTHEASHHETMYTDDVCAKGKEEDGSCKDGKVAYGRWTCEKLAREYPEEAVKNADSYCFFINDVALKP
ncbi:unnamed protein product [Symbiodinium sp. KB8]|nr:unnamed protein product [Symbiodinium sp. KB8]